jgi:hypothetical protein
MILLTTKDRISSICHGVFLLGGGKVGRQGLTHRGTAAPLRGRGKGLFAAWVPRPFVESYNVIALYFRSAFYASLHI